ncbi:MAG: hypothetical protein Pg6A_02740 [Termitinemataceae bacterium]|nr:MAG: hypothetical protein Pg6A_02740 [Termitinemataceae bacterium]
MKIIKIIRKCFKWCLPWGIVVITLRIREKLRRRAERRAQKNTKEDQQKDQIVNYFLGLKRENQNQEIIEIIDYIKKYGFSVFPYEFTRKYSAAVVNVFYDVSCKMCFVLHNNKKLYFPQTYSVETSQNYYIGLCLEQDEQSPHRYETKEFTVQDGEVIADIGAAEGIWALNYAEKAKKIYLFECENHWIEALKKTFEPWQEKTVIVNKYISNTNSGNKLSIDEFFKDKEINFIKADIEGAELELLEGGMDLLSNGMKNGLRGGGKLLLCAYHRYGDEQKLKEILENAGWTTEYSNRYMLFIYDEELKPPYIRRGLIRAVKNKEVQGF